MSEHAQSVQPQQSNATLNPAQLNALAEKFKELAQAIKALSQTESPEPISEEISKKSKEPDQIRCYRVPGFIVRYEQETLTEHRAADLLGLLRKARDDFHTTSTLLQNFHEDNLIDGFTVQQIGESLDHPLRMLNELCGIFADYKPLASEPSYE